jgi:hypothetical protein
MSRLMGRLQEPGVRKDQLPSPSLENILHYLKVAGKDSSPPKPPFSFFPPFCYTNLE